MGNVHMEASQINYRGGETKMSVEEAIKAGSSYKLPIASAATLGGVKIGTGISISEGGAISADAQLPSDPETDGTKVLTATTAEGTTTKFWAAPYTGFDYSTSEVNTGQKWIDGKDIYCKVIVLTDPVNVNGNTWLENVGTIAGETCISVVALNTSGYVFPFGGGFINGKFEIVNIRNTVVENVKTIICRYTKTVV